MKINLSTKPILIKQEDLKINLVSLTFPLGYVPFEEMYSLNLLTTFLNWYSIDYPKENLFLDALDDYMIGTFKVKSFSIGNSDFIRVSFYLPMEGIFEDFNLDKSLEFIHNTIFRNIAYDLEHLTDQEFTLEYESTKESLEKKTIGIYGFFNDEWVKQIDGKNQFATSTSDKLGFLSKTTKESVVNFYHKYILNNHFYTVVNGHIENKELFESTFLKYFKQDVDSFEFESDYYPYYNVNVNNEQVIHKDYNQSAVRMQFTKKNYTQDERYVLLLINTIINRNENNLLMNNLRFKNDLVYGCDSSKFSYLGCIEMTAFLSKNNIEKCKQLMVETLHELLDEDLFIKAKEKVMKTDKISLYAKLDDKFEKFYTINDKTLNIDTFEDTIEKVSKVSYEEVRDFINDMEITNTLVIVGDKND